MRWFQVATCNQKTLQQIINFGPFLLFSPCHFWYFVTSNSDKKYLLKQHNVNFQLQKEYGRHFGINFSGIKFSASIVHTSKLKY